LKKSGVRTNQFGTGNPALKVFIRDKALPQTSFRFGTFLVLK
jgi:hypothetical protein